MNAKLNMAKMLMIPMQECKSNNDVSAQYTLLCIKGKIGIFVSGMEITGVMAEV